MTFSQVFFFSLLLGLFCIQLGIIIMTLANDKNYLSNSVGMWSKDGAAWSKLILQVFPSIFFRLIEITD